MAAWQQLMTEGPSLRVRDQPAGAQTQRFDMRKTSRALGIKRSHPYVKCAQRGNDLEWGQKNR